MDFESTIGKTIDEIQKVMNTNSIIGQPIKTKDKTIIPISKTALGFGLGVATNSGDKHTELSGVGGGGSIDPVALLIVYDDFPGPNGVEIVFTDKQDTPLEDLLMGVGKTIFGFLENSNVEPATEVPADNSIEKIKTKIKPKKDK